MVARTSLVLLPTASSPAAVDAKPSSFLLLPHPRTRSPTLFLPSPDGETLAELQQIKPDPALARSWFVDQSVVSDGALNILTPFDPFFLLLSLTALLPSAISSNFTPLSDLFDSLSLTVPSLPALSQLDAIPCVSKRLLAMCDCQEYAGESLYRPSEAKALEVLKSKVEKLVDEKDGVFGAFENSELGLEKKGEDVKVGGGKPFSAVTKALAGEGAGDGRGCSRELQSETRQKTALNILSNYLTEDWQVKLAASYSFPLLTIHLATHSSSSSVLSTTYLPGRSSSSIADNLPSTGDKNGNGGGSAAAERAKKLKAENAKMSRGVKELKGVSKKGMKTLQEMFGAPKKAAVAKGK